MLELSTLSVIFLLDFGTVPTLVFFFLHFLVNAASVDLKMIKTVLNISTVWYNECLLAIGDFTTFHKMWNRLKLK